MGATPQIMMHSHQMHCQTLHTTPLPDDNVSVMMIHRQTYGTVSMKTLTFGNLTLNICWRDLNMDKRRGPLLDLEGHASMHDAQVRTLAADMPDRTITDNISRRLKFLIRYPL